MRTIRWMAVLAILALLGFASAALAKPPPGKPASRCGDGVVDSNEQCDQGSLGGASCQSLGYDLGTLTCGANCQFDTSQCRDTVCGDGQVEVGEQCDSGNLASETCVSLGYQTGDLSCSGSCEFDTASCGCRTPSLSVTGQYRQVVAGEDGNPAYGVPFTFQDFGDGTITDLNTGLTWEKKDRQDGVKDADNFHDVDNCYPWRGSCTGTGVECGTDADCANGTCDAADCQTASPDGLTIFKWVAALNAANFAGHDDWRVPNVKELVSIADYAANQTINPEFLPSQVNWYWSSTSVAHFPPDFYAWSVWGGFVSGFTPKTENYPVRAVRGGMQQQ